MTGAAGSYPTPPVTRAFPHALPGIEIGEHVIGQLTSHSVDASLPHHECPDSTAASGA
jgi:hypothetical protein